MSIFLKAEWRKLILANYSVSPSLLWPYLPEKTSLDLWNNTCYLSLVGFMFQNTKVKGIKIPFHVNFEEINLRFYITYTDHEGKTQRGVVFIREIVPRMMISFVARTIYNEPYVTHPMGHRHEIKNDSMEVCYAEKKKSKWNSLLVKTGNKLSPIETGSEAEFITEHYRGCTKTKKGTMAYEVTHPRWEQYKVNEYKIDFDFGKVYGEQFSFLNESKPFSVMLAEGSEITVGNGRKL